MVYLLVFPRINQIYVVYSIPSIGQYCCRLLGKNIIASLILALSSVGARRRPEGKLPHMLGSRPMPVVRARGLMGLGFWDMDAASLCFVPSILCKVPPHTHHTTTPSFPHGCRIATKPPRLEASPPQPVVILVGFFCLEDGRLVSCTCSRPKPVRRNHTVLALATEKPRPKRLACSLGGLVAIRRPRRKGGCGCCVVCGRAFLCALPYDTKRILQNPCPKNAGP